jgi:cephalosporin hydroxylase
MINESINFVLSSFHSNKSSNISMHVSKINYITKYLMKLQYIGQKISKKYSDVDYTCKY